jgi:hypothetical protein
MIEKVLERRNDHEADRRPPDRTLTAIDRRPTETTIAKADSGVSAPMVA